MLRVLNNISKDKNNLIRIPGLEMPGSSFGHLQTYFGLVLVDNDLARTQWREDIKKWTPKIAHEIHVDTYQALSNALELKKNALWKFIKDEHLSLIVYDEGDRAFNYEWGKSLALKSEGRLFLTATPFPRNVEDQISRRNLFGRMFATDWQRTMKAQKRILRQEE